MIKSQDIDGEGEVSLAIIKYSAFDEPLLEVLNKVRDEYNNRNN
jgi:hypothetical protein